MRSMRSIAVFIVCLSTVACVVAPENEDVLDSAFEELPFVGFVDSPGAEIQIEVWNHAIDAFEPIGRTTAGDTPSVMAGNSAYFWNVNAAVSVESDPYTHCRWSETCTVSPGDTLRVRVVKTSQDGAGPYTLFVQRQGGAACTGEQLRTMEAESLIDAYWTCRPPSDLNQIILHLGG